jgi:hypothetical protein
VGFNPMAPDYPPECARALPTLSNVGHYLVSRSSATRENLRLNSSNPVQATDNYGGGQEAARAMIEALGEAGGKVAILDHQVVESCILRVQGFQEVIEAHNPGSAGGAHHRGGIEAAKVEGSGSPNLAQRGCGKSGAGGAVARGDEADRGLDRGALGDGRARSSEPLLYRRRKAEKD